MGRMKGLRGGHPAAAAAAPRVEINVKLADEDGFVEKVRGAPLKRDAAVC